MIQDTYIRVEHIQNMLERAYTAETKAFSYKKTAPQGELQSDEDYSRQVRTYEHEEREVLGTIKQIAYSIIPLIRTCHPVSESEARYFTETITRGF